MQQLVPWLPQLLVTAVPGFVNVWLSGIEQNRYFQQKFPIFKPSKSSIWWFLQLLRFLVPAILFWWAAPIAFRIEPPSIKRTLDITLWGNAFAFGWGFVALINAPISILSAGMLETGTIYTRAVKGLREAIAAQENPKMRRFRRKLEAELGSTPHFSDKGFNDLAECLGVPYTYLSESSSELEASKAILVHKINAIKAQSTQPQKAEEIVKLLRTEERLTAQDWPELIRAFGGREDFIQQHFKIRSAKPPRGSRSRS